MTSMKTQDCRQWAADKCLRGDKRFFKHDPKLKAPTQRSSAVAAGGEKDDPGAQDASEVVQQGRVAVEEEASLKRPRGAFRSVSSESSSPAVALPARFPLIIRSVKIVLVILLQVLPVVVPL